jgi:hypothetical protein
MRLICLFFALAAPPDTWGQSRAWVAGAESKGEVVSADLPASEHMKNIGSRLDGAGMCVFTSFEHACLYAGIEEFRGFRDWCANRYPGGGYPQKLDQLVDAYCKAKAVKKPGYVQYEGRNFASYLEAADRTRRMTCTTYGIGERYGNRKIYHMVNGVEYNAAKYGAFLDNNFPGNYEWMDAGEARRRIAYATGEGWVVVLLAPPLPPPIK